MTKSPSEIPANRAVGCLSLVIPVFNEEETIPFLTSSLDVWAAKQEYPVQVVLVDDGSRDRSFELLSIWESKACEVRILRLSRNFGHQCAVTAGLEEATGDAVVIIDADLQDPLDVIPTMVRLYEEGFDVVYGRRTSRHGETRFKLFTAWLFYRLMKAFVHPDLPADTGDFRLVSRRCLDALLRLPERHRFLRGMFAWTGFRQAKVDYAREPRRYGTTKYPFFKMLRFAWGAVISFSSAPVRMLTPAGFLIAAAGMVYAAYSVIRKFVIGDTVPGWTALVVLQCIIGGLLLVGMGILGEYIGRIYEEVKGRPLFIVQDRLRRERRGGSSGA